MRPPELLNMIHSPTRAGSQQPVPTPHADRGPHDLRARVVGRALTDHRTQAGLTLNDIAAAYGASPATISRIENARTSITPTNLATLLGIYRIPAPERTRLLSIARPQPLPGWWTTTPTDHTSTLTQLHADAHTITTYGPHHLPPHLCPNAHPIKLNTNTYTAYLHETALRTATFAQLDHLLNLITSPRLILRAIPRHLPPISDATTAYHIHTHHPVIHLASLSLSALIDHPTHTQAYLDTLDQLADHALTPTTTTQLITQIRNARSRR